jgi:hypothetical protein
MRYNSGEQFILDNKNLYPFKYNENYVNDAYDMEPVGVSNKLITELHELQMLNYIKHDVYLTHSYIKSNKPKLLNSINENMTELLNIFKLKDNIMKLNIPVVVSGRLLYALALNKDYSFIKANNEDLERIVGKIVDKFVEKLDLADADSIACVLYALAKFNNFDSKLWNNLLNEVSKKSFKPDFTHVENRTPHLFRYREWKFENNVSFDDLGNQLYFKGT